MTAHTDRSTSPPHFASGAPQSRAGPREIDPTQVLPNGTDLSRAHDRNRRLALTAGSTLFAKAVSIATLLVSARLTLPYLGPERFGLWMTLTSIVTMLAFADLGIGNGLLNAVAHALGRDDRGGMRKSVSSAFFVLAAIGAVAAVAGMVLAWLLPWRAILNLTSEGAAVEAPATAAVLSVCLAGNIALGLVSRVQSGLQEGYWSNLWQALGNLAALAGVWMAVTRQLGLPWLALAMAGAPLAISLLNGLHLFGWRAPWLRPSWTSFSRTEAKALLGRGVMFVGFSVMAPLALYSDNIIAAHVVSAGAVADLSLHSKLFGLSTLLVGVFGGALWPAYGEAFSRNDHAWIRAALAKFLVYGTLSAAVPAAILVATAPLALELWVGRPIESPLALRSGLAVWVVASSAGMGLGSFLSSINMLKFNLAISGAMTLLAIPLKIVLGIRFGLAGVVWGVTAAYVVTLVPCAFYIPRLLARMRAGHPPRSDVLWLR